MKIALIAGEASGDILGADLIQALKAQEPDLHCFGVGGPLMAEQGLQSLVPMEQLAVMGLVEVVKHYPRLWRLRRRLIRDILDRQPDVVVGIDLPDFNLGLEHACHQAGIKTVHYVSPSVWAWRQGRLKTIARSVDLMLTLFPFELEIYRQHNIAAICVGHPLADQIPLRTSTAAARGELNLIQAPVLALLPGSRMGEVKVLAEPFLKAALLWQQNYANWQYVMPLVNQVCLDFVEAKKHEICPELPLKLYLGRSRSVMQAADLILLASGTATLEALLLKKPMVVAYRFNEITYQIFKRMIRLPYYSLPNLLAEKQLVPELIQSQVTPDNLFKALRNQRHAHTAKIDAVWMQIHRDLRRSAGQRAADALLALARNQFQ